MKGRGSLLVDGQKNGRKSGIKRRKKKQKGV